MLKFRHSGQLHIWKGLLPDGACDGMLGIKKEMDRDVANMTAFMARRYPGRFHPLAPVEIQSYIDRMMQDLGLRVDKKRMGWEWGLALRGGCGNGSTHMYELTIRGLYRNFWILEVRMGERSSFETFYKT
jgi:hypothetical protein